MMILILFLLKAQNCMKLVIFNSSFLDNGLVSYNHLIFTLREFKKYSIRGSFKKENDQKGRKKYLSLT